MRKFIDDLKSKQGVTLASLMSELVSKTEVATCLSQFSCDVEELQKKLKELVAEEKGILGRNQRGVSTSVLEVVSLAEKMSTNVFPEENLHFAIFLHALILHCNERTGDTAILHALEKSHFNFDHFLSELQDGSPSQSRKPSNKGAKSESAIDSLCSNLNQMAKEGKIDPVVGRSKEIEKTIQILSKKKKNNVVLVGKPGVGKTAIAEGLALAIVNGNVPHQIKNAVVYSLQVANMVAGTEYRGSFEKKMTAMIDAFKEKQENGEMAILFIDEIHSIVGGGGGDGLDFGNIIKPALSRGDLPCIGATTDEEWSKFFHDEKALKRRFTLVKVDEPSRDETLEILKGSKVHYERAHKVFYTDESLVKCVDLSIEFMPDQALPDKALDLFDLAGAIFKLKNVKEVGIEQIEYALSQVKNIAIESIQAKRNVDAVEPMAPKIKKSLYGQDNAVDLVVKAVEKSMAGLQRPDKPIGSFLFVGPTGVGKTELAKLLAKEIKIPFERVDMSEFMEQHSVSKFIGSPKGYVGSDEQSRLSKMFSRSSRFVLLLDEVEKAHPKVLEILLQIMDHAKVTDSKEEILDFKNVLILMTSNIGAAEMAESSISLLPVEQALKQINKKALSTHFQPEFLNRLNATVYFNSLTKDLILNIVEKAVNNLVKEPLLKRGIKVEVSKEAMEWIRDVSYDPAMGARPIERFVEAEINGEITQAILYGELKTAKKEVKISLVNKQLKFEYV